MFDKYFEVFLADNAQSREIHYQLRYQVYCVETGYEDAAKFPNGQEQDEFDSRAAHFIVRSRASGQWVAAMRLVVAPVDELPLSRIVCVDRPLLNALMKKQTGNISGRCAEISRLCVAASFRRRAHEKRSPFQIPWDPSDRSTANPAVLEAERRKAPWLKLGLIRAARDYSEQHGIRYWFFLIEDALARVLDHLGVGLEPVGPSAEFRGIRRPYMRDLRWGYRDIPTRSRDFMELLHQSNPYRLFSELKVGDVQPPEKSRLVLGR